MEQKKESSIEQNTNREIEINLKDMICFCFLHWRSALLIMIVFGMLFGGYSTLKNYKAEKSVIDAYDRYDAAIADGISDDAKLKSAINNETVYKNIKNQNMFAALNGQISILNDDISKNEKYLSEAEIMKIDPNKVYFSNTVIALKVPDAAQNGTLNSLIQTYKSNMLSRECKKEIESKTKIKEKYIRGLLTVNSSVDNITDADKSGTVGTVTLYIVGKNENDVKVITEAVLKDFNKASANLTAIFGEHEFEVMKSSYGITADNTITEKGDDIKEKISTDRTSLTQAEATLNALTITPRPTIDRNALTHNLLKKGVEGSAVIFLLYGFLLCIIYATSGGAITKTQFIARYKLLELGTFANASEGIYHRNGKFDKWLRKKMKIAEKTDDREKVCDMIAANLSVYAADKINIIITGSATVDEKVKLVSDLQNRNHDITFLHCESITNNADDRSKLRHADGVIFFEKYGVSRYSDMNQEVMLVSNAGIDIVGYVAE